MWTALDTETKLATNREPVPRLVSVALANDLGILLFAAHDPRLPAIVRGVLRGGVVGANFPFDAFVLGAAFPALWPEILDALANDRVADVLTREKLIDIAEGQHFRRGKYGLGDVALRRAGITVDKSDPWRKRYGTLLGLEIAQWPPEAVDYACKDAWAHWHCFKAQELERANHRLDVFADAGNQARAHIALYAQTLRGIHTDAERVELFDRRLGAEIDLLRASCERFTLGRWTKKKGVPHFVRSEKVAKGWLEALAAVDPLITITRNPITDAAKAKGETVGSISLGEEALETAGIPTGVFVAWPYAKHDPCAHRWGGTKCELCGRELVFVDRVKWADGDGELVEAHALDAYRRLGATTAQRTKNVPVFRHPVIRTRYDECIASGRTSSSGYKPRGARLEDENEDDTELDESDPWVGTSLQNLDTSSGIRECLVPPPPDEREPLGYDLGISDFSALELVTLAQDQVDLFRHSALADVLRDPARGDPHGEFGADMLGIPYSEFDKTRKDHKRARTGAKAFNFGKPGGMGSKRFIRHARATYGFDMTEAEERALTEKWKRKFPEMDQSFDYVRRYCCSGKRYDANKGKSVDVYTVVHPWSGLIRGGMGYPDACNTRFQSRGASVAKLALWWLFLAGLDPRSPLYGCYQCLFVHDENVTVIPRRLVYTDANGVRRSPALDEQDRIMIAAAAVVCPDVPIKVESAIHDRYTK